MNLILNACSRFQLYNSSVPALSMSMLTRAKAAGYGAIVVTLDTVKYGYRTEELDAAYFPQGMQLQIPNFGIQDYSKTYITRCT